MLYCANESEMNFIVKYCIAYPVEDLKMAQMAVAQMTAEAQMAAAQMTGHVPYE